MFTDKFRWFKIVLPIICIIIFVFYAYFRGPFFYPGYREAKKSPQQFIGKSIYFGGKIIKINKNDFFIEVEKKPVKVLGSLDKNKLHYSINGKAIYLADGSLKLSQYHTSNLRIYKIILSIIPIILIAYLFFKEYKFDKKTCTFVKINN